MLLSVKDLVVSYGAIRALHGISFDVEEGELVTLIGANGAGKSTALWSIMRQVGELGGRVVSGSITYKGADLLSYACHDVVNKLGVSLVPEGRRVFGNLTVLENLRLATFARKDKAAVTQDLERVFAIFPRLGERKKQLADLLSGGEQQMLAVGRALMTHASLMLLDEQNANMALKYASRAYVLETGAIVLSGPAQEVGANAEVRKAYLGG